MLEAGQLVKSLGVSVHDIVDQVDIVERGSCVQYAFGSGSSNTAAITTGVGKRIAEEMLRHQT